MLLWRRRLLKANLYSGESMKLWLFMTVMDLLIPALMIGSSILFMKRPLKK